MKKEYSKPGMMVTCYDAVDKTNLKLVGSAPIAAYTANGQMSGQSFKLHS